MYFDKYLFLACGWYLLNKHPCYHTQDKNRALLESPETFNVVFGPNSAFLLPLRGNHHYHKFYVKYFFAF